MNFYGRDRELDIMNKFLSTKNLMVALIYGRRRVGKSELIRESIRRTNLASIYYECKETTEKNNVESLSLLLSENFGLPPLAFTGIEQCLDFIFKRQEKEPGILVLDEYPYLRATVKGLDSILQALIDKYRETSLLKLVICGSYVETMKSLLTVDNPLYGRVDRTINLKQMDYLDSSLFYAGFSDEDKVRLYSVFGGIPYYNRLINPNLSVKQNIIELIASNGSRLENEVSMYLKSELGKMNNANEVFEALAQGRSRFNDILTKSNVSSSPTLADVLEKLVRMEVVKKTSPINDENNKRKAGYYISDQLSLFYYRYCFRYSSQLNVMPPEQFYDRYIDQDFEKQFVPHAFEEICRQYLIRQNLCDKALVPFDRIGRYWYDDPETHTNGEFDIVTEKSGRYVFYEAKFRDSPITSRMIKEEKEQARKSGLNCTHFGFFSRKGFEATEDRETLLIDIHELFL